MTAGGWFCKASMASSAVLLWGDTSRSLVPAPGTALLVDLGFMSP